MIHKHFKTKAKFNEELNKTPNSGISDSDICFIKDTAEIWTHGKFYKGTDTDTNDNTTYQLSTGTGADANKIVLTPSSGTADKITVPYATNSGTVNSHTVNSDVPANASFDPHYSSEPVAGGSSATTNATSKTSNPYINIVENGSKVGGVQIKGSGGTDVSAKDGVITVNSTAHPTTTAVAAAAKKVGCDSLGHVVLGANLTKSDVGLGNVTDHAQVKGLDSGTTENHVVVFGTDGYSVKDSGKTIGVSVPADAKFTDSHYDGEVTADSGCALKKVKVDSSGIWTKEQISIPSAGSITSGETGFVTGGDAYTALAGKADLVNGVVPADQLPSFVDDIVELLKMDSTAPATCSKGDYYYNTSTKKIVRATGTNTWGTGTTTNTDPEKSKIYFDKNEQKSYRWSGSAMLEIHDTLSIGTSTGTAADGKVVNDHITSTINPHNVTVAQIGAVSIEANQGLTDTEKSNARANIGASSFSGSYNDLTNKPVIPALIGDDAAVANWGGDWRMPTTAEFQALGTAVNTAWTADYQSSGVAGLVCTDKTDSSKTLFFPAAGYCDDGSVENVGFNGSYWSSSLDTGGRQSACYLYFHSNNAYWDNCDDRYYGFSIRPILDGTNANGHDYVEIGGIKLATMNIGANSVTDYGLYFQWGDTQGYTASQCGSGAGQKYFGWEDYKYGNGTSSPSATDMTKYNDTDSKTVLELPTPIDYLHKVAVTGNYNDLSNKPTSLPANGGDADTVNGHTVNSDVPANAVFTDTTYKLTIGSTTNGDSTNGTSLGTLGTAALKDAPSSGNASSSQVVMGNDTRLTNSRTPTSHTHGNIQNTGALQSSDVTIANGDKLVITDSSDSGKVARASVEFDGSTKTKALTKNGTFETFVSTAASQGLTDTEKANARTNIGAGTSCIKDVPSSGDASDTQVVLGSDSRLANNIRVTIEKTWSELKALRDNNTLVPGQWYRITDFVTTTVQADTQSAGYAFDIIVRADSTNVLNENAYAAKHSGDSHFSSDNMSAWELKYCINNDTDRFAWADSTNGKGVIYYMKDEFNNECPYDFKNIRFKVGAKTQPDTKDNVYYYTFSASTVRNDTTITDHSRNGKYCHDNCIKRRISSGRQTLNFNIFRNTAVSSGCYNNIFGNDCHDNTFGNSCSSNTFGNSFSSNIFGNSFSSNIFGNGCSSNIFGNYCSNNTFGGYCYNNTFGNSCGNNTFGNSCYNNTFGNSFSSNIFGNSFSSNIFGNGCSSNTFGNYCSNNTFGSYCYNNTFGTGCYHIAFMKQYTYYVIVENGNQYITLTSTQTTSSSYKLQNIKIALGVNNTSTTKTISHDTLNDEFQTEYKATNSQTILI